MLQGQDHRNEKQDQRNKSNSYKIKLGKISKMVSEINLGIEMKREKENSEDFKFRWTIFRKEDKNERGQMSFKGSIKKNKPFL